MSDLSVIFEDSDILVVDKPAGLVVEKDRTSSSEGLRTASASVKTLEDILSSEYGIGLPRAGIVHRLDRDTSGVMVVAKNEATLVSLQNQFASHLVDKKYIALVYGDLRPVKGTINIGLKRDLGNRTRFVPGKGEGVREAITHYEVLKTVQYDDRTCSLVGINLETGRTHQIRAHFLAIGYPVIGDSVYANPGSRALSQKLGLFRQFLHAGVLSFTHPRHGKRMSFESQLPEELERLLVKK